ncbi:ABC transporter ATP-binding protein [Labrenzia aggregata]|uniref:ABC transporter ATP-binding protein n=1 Tax=Roseibium aggregatum TaxID=187304 RepID=A0A939ECH3_9HYPH|nr:ABC transporter ATP-binding protein [Roseibium aggregatum]
MSLDGLSAEIGGQTILRDVDLDIERGECVAVVGGSGTGKSTLLRCLMGLYRPARPSSGRLTFDGRTFDLTSRKRQKSRHEGFAFVPQNPQVGLDPLKRLSWQWSQALRCARFETPEADGRAGVLKALRLDGFGKRFPHQWSQGMQQRLLLAFALISKPKLLVLDEPTSALDPIVAARAISEVMTYARRHQVSVLIVTHDLALAAKFAQRTAVMTDGQVAEFGPTQRLLAAPRTKAGQLLVTHRQWPAPSTDGPVISAGQSHVG